MADVYELDAKTGKVTLRDYTEAEAEQRTKDLAKHAALAKADKARAKAKAAVIEKLGLTADELAALLS
jgi:phage-related minor tail protein